VTLLSEQRLAKECSGCEAQAAHLHKGINWTPAPINVRASGCYPRTFWLPLRRPPCSRTCCSASFPLRSYPIAPAL